MDPNTGFDFQCYTLEDTFRAEKVANETRIPAGNYRIELRDAGNVVKGYKKRYPWHKGMLWLQDVEDFTWIYIHEGNHHGHTSGCILVGDGVRSDITKNDRLSDSADAYLWIYKRMSAEIEAGDEVWLTITDVG